MLGSFLPFIASEADTVHLPWKYFSETICAPSPVVFLEGHVGGLHAAVGDRYSSVELWPTHMKPC